MIQLNVDLSSIKTILEMAEYGRRYLEEKKNEIGDDIVYSLLHELIEKKLAEYDDASTEIENDLAG